MSFSFTESSHKEDGFFSLPSANVRTMAARRRVMLKIGRKSGVECVGEVTRVREKCVK